MKRYEPFVPGYTCNAIFEEDENGTWVRYEDVETLKEENARMKEKLNVPILERTDHPYTLRYSDDFDNLKVVTPIISLKMFYNDRYRRLSIDPVFVEDNEEKAGQVIMNALKRLLQEVEGGKGR